jgi:hypothetical protein
MMSWIPWWGLVMLAPQVHDFHYSRADWQWNGKTQTFEVTIRVFTDDWEAALATEAGPGNAGPMRLGDARENPKVPEWARVHLDKNVRLMASGKPVPLEYLGMEVEYDITYLYLESVPVPWPQPLAISQTLFFDLFSDQTNEVHVKVPTGVFQESLQKGSPRLNVSP